VTGHVRLNRYDCLFGPGQCASNGQRRSCHQQCAGQMKAGCLTALQSHLDNRALSQRKRFGIKVDLKMEHFVMDSKETREDKLEKPHTHFDRPQDILADPALSREEKAEALEKLEQDARHLTVAAQEGMTGGEENKLQEVLDAKKALEEPGGSPNSATADNPPPGSDAEVAAEAEIEKLDP
jgi:hypothetical protein